MPEVTASAHDHLITGTGNLLDEQGCLREPGYALQPPFAYNRSDIAAPKWRIKDWDYYLVNDDEYALALTYSDLGYLGLISASVMDFATRTFKTTSEIVPFTFGSLGVPLSSAEGDIAWENKRCRVEYRHVTSKGCVASDGASESTAGPAHNGDSSGSGSPARRLSFSMKNFDGERDLEAELLLDNEPQDSMVIATPWAEDPTAFYYNQKIIGMRARGGFRVGEHFHEFDASDSLGLLDWGRGVWTYENTWYWAAAQGWQDGHLVGLNLGYGFGDTSAASENMIFYDGVCHKLHWVDFGIPQLADGSFDYSAPWHITDDEGRLDLEFSSQIDRTDNINVANIIVSNQHQVFGVLTGRLALDDGTQVQVNGLRGSAEHIYNKY